MFILKPVHSTFQRDGFRGNRSRLVFDRYVIRIVAVEGFRRFSAFVRVNAG
jgi:hypothetical protein